MKIANRLSAFATAALFCLEFVTSAHATLVPVVQLASDNATVQNGGPRTGVNGKSFFNLEGSTAGGASFSSFGVADFSFAGVSLGGTATNVTGASLQLTQSNAGFSATGPVSVYLSTQTGVSIQPTNLSLNYVTGNNGLASVDTDLAPLTLLGTGIYTASVPATAGSGTQDFYALTFTDGPLTTLLNAINSGGTLRLVITPDSATTAATYAGFSNATLAGPTLAFFAVVPEPGSVALFGVGAVLIIAKRGYHRPLGVGKPSVTRSRT